VFRFEWRLFNVKLGLIYMVGVLIVFGLMGKSGFDMMAAGVSALLAWLTIILAPGERWRRHVFGLVIYLIGGAMLTGLAYSLLSFELARLTSMVVVTFIGYLVLLRGAHPFLVAWCLVYWYLLAPLFIASSGFLAVLIGHLTGAGLVLALNLVKPIWSQAVKEKLREKAPGSEAGQDGPPLGDVIRYASVVALTIGAGLAAGTRFISSDPTLIANATLNMISPSFRQTWIAGAERLICGTVGILAGFYLGWFYPEPWVGYPVTVVISFLTVAVLYINLALAIGLLFFMVSYPWGTMQSDLGHLFANEKLIGEVVGVGFAIVAIGILTWLQRWVGARRD
jgi:hypothetical protein